MNKNKIKILVIVGNLGAVAQVRLISPLTFMKNKGLVEFKIVDLSKEEDNQINYIPDIVVIQRLNHISYYSFIALLKSKGSKIIFELDDNLLEIPEKNPAYTLYSDANQRRGFLEYIWLADELIVSTEELKQYYSQFNKNITVVPNQIDEQIFINSTVPESSPLNLRIGFAGTTTHREDFLQVEDALKKLQKKYKDKIKLVFINMIPDSFVTDKSVEFIPGTGYLTEYAKKLIEANLDIGLAPLVPNKFNLAKSDIKFLEYAISGIAGIYSNFGPYSETIEDYNNGLLVNVPNSDEWFMKICYLIENPNEINRIKNNAFKYVKEKRTVELNYKNWLNVFQKVTGRKSIIKNNGVHQKQKKLKIYTETNGDESLSLRASILILTKNNKNYSQECIQSIYENTLEKFELIVIDNNSTDDTRKYLEKLKSQHENVKIIFNKENVGFPAGVNQGILEAKTENIIVVNNDIVVTKGWLTKLLAVSASDENIGIVGPISNSVSGVQFDENAIYNSVEDMHAYADKITVQNAGQTLEFPRVAFLCTLIKKEVIDKIGGLDERFSPGNFEDDDFCLRSQLAGFKTLISKDVFIHHYGSVSFKNNGEDRYAEILKVNEQKFIDKWGSNPEGIWLKGSNIKKHSIDIPLNSDKFIQFFERSMRNIDDEEFHYAIENLNLAMEHYETSSKSGYENISLEDLLNIAGNLALTKNNLEDAKKYFEKQLETNPSSSNACFGLAEVFNIAEMFYESKTMLEWTLNNDSKHEKAQERLKEINRKLNLPENHNSLIEQDIKK